MSLKFTKICAGALLLAAPLACQTALAHQAGDWVVKVGATVVSPDSDNGSLNLAAIGASSRTGVDVKSNTQPSISVAYMFTDNFGLELLAATPFQHDIYLDGLSKVGSTKHLPPTLTAQWYFAPTARINPYVGVGLNYTTFFNEDESGAVKALGAELELDDSWGVAVQVGADIDVTDTLFANVSVRWIDIDTDVTVKPLGKVGTANIDPIVTTIGFGMRF